MYSFRQLLKDKLGKFGVFVYWFFQCAFAIIALIYPDADFSSYFFLFVVAFPLIAVPPYFGHAMILIINAAFILIGNFSPVLLTVKLISLGVYIIWLLCGFICWRVRPTIHNLHVNMNHWNNL